MPDVVLQQAERFLSVTTPLGPDKLVLTGFEGVEEMSRLFSYRLQMVSKDKNIDIKKILGQSISVAIGPPQKRRWFNGICNRWEMGGDFGRDYRIYHAQIVPKLWLLTRRTNIRTFQHLATPDILKEVLGAGNGTFQLQGSFDPRNYCVQYRETDFNFISRLMEEEGIFYYFKHSEGKHELVLANSSQWPDSADNEVEYRTDLDINNAVAHVSGWTPRYDFRSGKLTLRDQNFELPDKNFEQSKNTLLEVNAFKEHELYDFFGYGDYAVLDGVDKGGGDQPANLQKIFQHAPRLAGVRMQEEEARYEEVDGQGNCRGFSPGLKFKVTKHVFPEQQNKDYFLIQVRHSASDLTHLPAQGGAPTYTNSFICAPTARQWRPASITPKPRVQGPHTAFVVGTAGEEIFTDKYGRVKIQFVWDRQGQKDADSSCWVRVAQMWAGKQWGSMFIPRVGMEVIVDFLDGDPDRPIITGCVYNADFMPPYTLPDNKTQSGVKTRSSKSGGAADFNELRFEDKKDSEDIYFHAQKDFHRVVENDDDLKVGHDQTIEVKNHRTETVKEGHETVTIEKGKRTHTVEGDESLTVKTGHRTVSVDTGNDTHTVKTGNREVSVDTGNDKHTIKTGNRDVSVDMGNDTLTIKMGNQTTKLSLGKQEVEAMQSIELKVGQSSVKIDQTGVTIKGMMVTIEGQTMLEAKGLMTTVKGTAMTTVQGALVKIGP
jgi:type VI secretion system secreted protein VgrG